jgi:hypothetical protein
MSHLYIASRVLSMHSVSDRYAAAFLLGSIAPDAAQFREGYKVSDKLITHICPDNGEAWGRVTANDWWKDNVNGFIKERKDNPFAMGYGTHVFGDIFNNIEIWGPFIKANPTAKAGGYSSGSGNAYYTECGCVDARLYYEKMKGSRWLDLLGTADAEGLPGLIGPGEVKTIRDDVLYVSYPKTEMESTDGHEYITYEKLLRVTENAAEYILAAIFPTRSGES